MKFGTNFVKNELKTFNLGNIEWTLYVSSNGNFQHFYNEIGCDIYKVYL